MPSPLRLAAVDLDGTLLSPDKTVSETNRQALMRMIDAGIRVVLASGRRGQDVERFQSDLDLKGTIISCNGALVHDTATNEVLGSNFMPASDAYAVAKRGIELGWPAMIFRTDGIYASRESDEVARFRKQNSREEVEVCDLDDLPDGDILKVMWLAPTATLPGLLTHAAAVLPESEAMITSSYHLEVMSAGTGKGSALAALAKTLGISAEEVAAFGDADNDVSMLTWAGHGVAMPHGSKAARAAAKLIGPESERETAFARAVELLLGAY